MLGASGPSPSWLLPPVPRLWNPSLQDYRSWLGWAVFERRQRNFEAAERCFVRGTQVAPGYPYLWCDTATQPRPVNRES
jgi:hypothetical protein